MSSVSTTTDPTRAVLVHERAEDGSAEWDVYQFTIDGDPRMEVALVRDTADREWRVAPYFDPQQTVGVAPARRAAVAFLAACDLADRLNRGEEGR